MSSSDFAVPSPVITFRPAGPSQIIFDLGSVNVIDQIIVGSWRKSSSSNVPPSTVNFLFSTTGINSADFGPAMFVNLSFPTGEVVHVDSSTAVPNVSARYVKLDFPSQGGEKFMLDEISIFGTAEAVPEPSTLAIGGLVALVGGGVAWRRRKRTA